MLTKALLRYSVRKNKVHPKFLDHKKSSILEEARSLINLFSTASGETLGDLQNRLSSLDLASGPVLNGFEKLLFERLVFFSSKTPEEYAERRWKIVVEAQKLRSEQLFESVEAYYEFLADRLSDKLENIREELYSDLPEYQKIKSFEPLSEAELLDKYNLGQVQGLLLQAKKLKVVLRGVDLSFKRALFRQIKFHRLLCHPLADEAGVFSFELSGPLSLFTQKQTYGMRLALFFPSVLCAKSWSIEADLLLKSNSVSLELDSSSPLPFLSRLKQAYQPKELLSFIDSFNKKGSAWKASESSCFLNMGEKSYCFPDIELRNRSGRVLFLELFHRWHVGPFNSRLAS